MERRETVHLDMWSIWVDVETTKERGVEYISAARSVAA